MKLTRKQRAALESVLYDAERARAYIFSDDTAVAHVQKQATTTRDFTRKADGRVLYEVEKAYGSHLCGLPDAVEKLKAFLAADAGR